MLLKARIIFTSGCDYFFLAFLCCFSFKWYLSTLEFWEREMKNIIFFAADFPEHVWSGAALAASPRVLVAVECVWQPAPQHPTLPGTQPTVLRAGSWVTPRHVPPTAGRGHTWCCFGPGGPGRPQPKSQPLDFRGRLCSRSGSVDDTRAGSARETAREAPHGRFSPFFPFAGWTS